ncbi:MAG: hypothetical protein R2754_15890 [Microthrixaceae bacterium]
MADRWVVLGLAPPRSAWFSDVTRWATSGLAPVEFVKCLSASEVRARLATGRAHSALLADARAASLDRDLIAAARDAGVATLVVDDQRVQRNWLELGAAAVLPGAFARDDLTDALTVAASPIAETPATSAPSAVAAGEWRGRLLAVVGRGGVGTSTVAMAVAQALADPDGQEGAIALVDLSFGASQAMYHDTGDVVPGIVELVEAHRHGYLDRDRVREYLWELPDRRYHLLAGLRRRRDWTALRPHAFAAALEGLLSTYSVVVADLDADVDGEAETASADLEEYHVAARTTLAAADQVIAVGGAGLWGVAHLAGLLDDLARYGVDAGSIATVVNRAPRSPARRAEIVRALAVRRGGAAPASMQSEPSSSGRRRRRRGRLNAGGPTAFIPERASVEASHRAAVGLPRSVLRPIHALVAASELRGDDGRPNSGEHRADDTLDTADHGGRTTGAPAAGSAP